MIVLSGAALVLPDRVLSPGTLVIDEGRIAEIRFRRAVGRPERPFRFSRPLHRPRLHRRSRARRRRHRLARHAAGERRPSPRSPSGCRATASRRFVRRPSRVDRKRCAGCSIRCGARANRLGRAPLAFCRRISRANFINPEYAGAQPSECLRLPRAAPASRGSGRAGGSSWSGGSGGSRWARRTWLDGGSRAADFTAADILAEIERAAPTSAS